MGSRKRSGKRRQTDCRPSGNGTNAIAPTQTLEESERSQKRFCKRERRQGRDRPASPGVAEQSLSVELVSNPAIDRPSRTVDARSRRCPGFQVRFGEAVSRDRLTQTTQDPLGGQLGQGGILSADPAGDQHQVGGFRQGRGGYRELPALREVAQRERSAKGKEPGRGDGWER